MARRPYGGGYYNQGGGGYDSGDSDSADDDGVDTGDVLDGGGSSGSDPRTAPDPSPGGSSPPPSDVGGPGGDSGGVDTGDVLDGGGSSGSDPRVGGGAEPETVSGSTRVDATAGPGAMTPAGRGSIDVGGGESYPIAEEIADAEANAEIVDRATTGGLLSERGGTAGLLPSEAFGVDISETRAREGARRAARFGGQLDVGAAFSSPADPLGSGGEVREGRDIVDTGAPADGYFAPLSGDPENENFAEEFVEGGAQLGPNLLGAPLQAETGAEIVQSAPGIAQDFDLDEIGETSTAVGRDIAAETATRARRNPGEFAGGVAGGLIVGGGLVGRGGGSLRGAVRAELDPRVGPFGTTAETRLFRGARDFLDDDRGQASLLGRQRGDGDSADTGSVSDDDLGPDLDAFDRSDARLYDPSREFDEDIGGMAPRDIDDALSANPSRDDIGGGVSGQGNPQAAPGVDLGDGGFSERGFGDVEGTSLDPNPTSTLGSDSRTPTGATLARLDADAALGGAAGGLLGAPGEIAATEPELDVDPTGDLRGGVDLDTDFPSDVDTSPGLDSDTGTRGDTRTDTRGDTDPTLTDVGADLDSLARADPVARDADPDIDPRTRDPTRRDPATVDTPDRVDRDFPIDDERDPFEEDIRDLSAGYAGEVITNPTRSLDDVDDALVQDLASNDEPYGLQ